MQSLLRGADATVLILQQFLVYPWLHIALDSLFGDALSGAQTQHDAFVVQVGLSERLTRNL